MVHVILSNVVAINSFIIYRNFIPLSPLLQCEGSYRCFAANATTL